MCNERRRASFYFDGFNFYHALNDLNKPSLKWMNIRSLAHTLAASRGDNLVEVSYFSAIRIDIPEKAKKHQKYIDALLQNDVHVELGHFSREKRKCFTCKNRWEHPTEKETDINLSLKVIMDAVDDKFDVAYIVTTDGDQRPTFDLLKSRFRKDVVTVATPGRNHNFSLMEICGGSQNAAKFTTRMLESNRLPDNVNGILIPDEYKK